MVYRVVSYDIRDRHSVQNEENGPQYWALRHTIHELWWWWRQVIDWSGLISVWEVWLSHILYIYNKKCNRNEACSMLILLPSVTWCWLINVSSLTQYCLTCLSWAGWINNKNVNTDQTHHRTVTFKELNPCCECDHDLENWKSQSIFLTCYSGSWKCTPAESLVAKGNVVQNILGEQ